MSFSVTNKNVNLEIITKNLITFKFLKDGMKLRMKHFDIMKDLAKKGGAGVFEGRLIP